MKRTDGRLAAQARDCAIETNFVKTADGSCLITIGNTRVICTASIEESVPPFLRGKEQGWVTAEYAMLPASTGMRKKRDGVQKDGRGVEIQRLIGRSLRQAVDMTLLGQRTITLDCDVLQADGGTRTASITGAFVALTLAVYKLMQNGLLQNNPIIGQVAAVSVGVVNDEPMLDLCYSEDSTAQTDMNLVMNHKGEFIELQGTGEGRAFTERELRVLLQYGRQGILSLMKHQRIALHEVAHLLPLPRLAVASANAHKLKELRALLKGVCEPVGMRDLGVTEDVDETGETFAQNAILKAEAVMKATGLPALADDSGLAVDALGGAPGVRSARYAGEHGNDAANNKLLLHNMEKEDNRACKFVCSMALAIPAADTITVSGECHGTLLKEPRGTSGFGYDPLFLYETGKTFAELSQAEKNKVSHRARATEQVLKVLHDLFWA
ncbi:MAG TPA: ribonuclease PH [Candidatus Limiplasma sp.]|nr:ribonuclease PH [Candidatus Limiplasma sp.]HRX07775.1 ribonuclease PH [Candidatus Limiplasma sp.]